MKLIKLFKRLKELQPGRKDYKIKPHIKFYIESNDYAFSFIPTIVWEPWINRFPGTAVIDIWWLNMHILIGKWVYKEESKDA